MTNSPINKAVLGIRGVLLLITVASSYLVAIGNTRGLMLELDKAYGQATSLESSQNEKLPGTNRDTSSFSSSSESNEADGQATSLESAQNEKRSEKNQIAFSSSKFRPNTTFPDSFFRDPLPMEANPHQPVTIVVQLDGEMGNYMHQITGGLCVKDHVEKKLGLKTEIKLRAQEYWKWERAMNWTKQAFPKTRSFDFRAANTEEFDHVRKLQEQWLQHLVTSKELNLTGVQDPTTLNHFKSTSKIRDVLILLNQTMYMERPSLMSNNFSIPHVYVDARLGYKCIERLLDDLKDFFAFDEEKNCKQVPDPDESVLHLRNFLVECGDEKGRMKGLEELSPNKTALEIFADYKPGDKVAIISRFEENTDKYIHALKTLKGIDARYIKGQTGNQDFCFLLKTQQEIIGQRRSTFVTWASMLGNAKKSRLYSVDSEYTRALGGQHVSADGRFYVKQLRDRIVFENYKAED
eukprot:scaffold1025_cov102-Cylindrotheca_fusiformis.AAC.7